MDTLTNDAIEALRQEAARAGDWLMATTCDLAMRGDEDARAECAEAIADARAQDDSE